MTVSRFAAMATFKTAASAEKTGTDANIETASKNKTMILCFITASTMLFFGHPAVARHFI
jgi:hypothetical protein